MQLNAKPSAHLNGRVMWAVINEDGTTANSGTLEPAEPSSNLVLDQGIDLIGSNPLADCFKHCAIGTGTSTPDATQVELDNEHARTNNFKSSLCGTNPPADGSDPYVVTMKRGWDFPKGSLDSSVDGDYAEVGFSPNSSAGQNLFSRALIKDESDNPITVTVASDQILRVAYELDLTVGPASPVSSTVDITNIGTLNYEMQIGQVERLISYVDDQGARTGLDGSLLEPGNEGDNVFFFFDVASEYGNYSFGGPTWNSSLGNPDHNNATYNPRDFLASEVSSGVWEYTFDFSTSEINLTDIKHIMLANRDEPGLHIQFDNGSEFTKEDTHELTLNFEITYTAN